jgi:hypothetical protein
MPLVDPVTNATFPLSDWLFVTAVMATSLFQPWAFDLG